MTRRISSGEIGFSITGRLSLSRADLCPGDLGKRVGWRWRMRHLDGHGWQSDLERRAAARCLVDLDLAAMSANKSMADRQADARYATNRLGCKVRLEHA